MRIGLIDSGIGGLTLLKELRKVCPSNDYTYFADTYAHPYGKWNSHALKTRLVNVAELLYEIGSEVIIFACNTATTIALDEVQEKLPIPILGVKPECANPKNSLILCTPLTATTSLIKGYQDKGAKVYTNLCLASLIERYVGELDVLNDYLKSELSTYPKPQNLVLGCTHYVYVSNQLEKITGATACTGFESIITFVKSFSTLKGEGSIKYIFSGPRKAEEYAQILKRIH